MWIQYFEHVNIMRLFVRAKRTGDWYLHPYAVKQTLPDLHAAGHLTVPSRNALEVFVNVQHDTTEHHEELRPTVMLSASLNC